MKSLCCRPSGARWGAIFPLQLRGGCEARKSFQAARCALCLSAMSVTRAAAHRARVKLLGSILTNYGYALLGGAAIQPLLSGQAKLTASQVVGGLLSLVLQGVAVYIAPYGEKS